MASSRPPHPSFAEALRFWLKLGLISFGGPAGQIAVLHRELVETKRWISESRFLSGLNFCMFLPGPEAQQLTTYLGWRLHGAKGGIAAGSLFVLPSVFILLALSWIYVIGGHLHWIASIFHGLSAAVVAVVFEAAWRIGGKALRGPLHVLLALGAFVGIRYLGISFLWILLASALIGCLSHRFRPWISRRRRTAPAPLPMAPLSDVDLPDEEAGFVDLPPTPWPTWRRQGTVLGLCLALWWGPVLAVGTVLGWDSTPAKQGLFFSKAALITFGGAYAVLPYVAEQAVEEESWLDQGQMMAGLALAETTPGPLIMVLQFVGFVGGWQAPGDLSPMAAALLGALLTTWVTFLPCFLFVFLAAPLLERMHRWAALSATFAAITAAVVGVVLNLAVTFATHALWPGGTLGRETDWLVAGLALVAFLLLKTRRVGLLPVIGGCALVGWLGGAWGH